MFALRLHRATPDALLDKVVEMIASSQGAPFLLNFDERSIAGLMLEAEKAGVTDLIHPANVYDYAPVGCLENTMCGNDRSGTVDNNLNLLKAVELALTGGYDLIPYTDPLTGKTEKPQRWGPATGAPEQMQTWEQFWQAYEAQTRFIIQKSLEVYEKSEAIRAKFFPTPYLSCLAWLRGERLRRAARHGVPPAGTHPLAPATQRADGDFPCNFTSRTISWCNMSFAP